MPFVTKDANEFTPVTGEPQVSVVLHPAVHNPTNDLKEQCTWSRRNAKDR